MGFDGTKTSRELLFYHRVAVTEKDGLIAV